MKVLVSTSSADRVSWTTERRSPGGWREAAGSDGMAPAVWTGSHSGSLTGSVASDVPSSGNQRNAWGWASHPQRQPPSSVELCRSREPCRPHIHVAHLARYRLINCFATSMQQMVQAVPSGTCRAVAPPRPLLQPWCTSTAAADRPRRGLDHARHQPVAYSLQLQSAATRRRPHVVSGPGRR